MKNVKLLSACFVAVPFFIVVAYPIPIDVMTLIVEVVIFSGIVAGIIMAAVAVADSIVNSSYQRIQHGDDLL